MASPKTQELATYISSKYSHIYSVTETSVTHENIRKAFKFTFDKDSLSDL